MAEEAALQTVFNAWKMQQMQRGNFHPSALLMPAIVHQLNPQQFLIANGLIVLNNAAAKNARSHQ